MKKLVFLFSLLFLAQTSLAFEVPAKPASFVSDFAGVLSASQKVELETKLSNYERGSTNEIAVVTIKSLDGDVIENVAQEIFTKWGIGKEGKNNGVLVLIAIDDRESRIQTGYGAEGDLTDLETAYIQDETMLPYFREDDYFSGLSQGVDSIMAALGGASVVPEEYGNKSSIGWENAAILGFIILQWLGAVLARSKSWWAGGVVGGVLGGIVWMLGLFAIFGSIIFFVFSIGFGLVLDYFVSKSYQKYKLTGGHYPWWIGGGRGGGGFGGGGFGGFGGGMSGGGGSSRSW